MNEILSVATIVLVMGVQEPRERFWERGSWCELTLQPRVTIRADDSEATVRLLIVRPLENDRQRIVTLTENHASSRLKRDKDGVNEALEVAAEVAPDEQPVVYDYTALVHRRAVRLKFDDVLTHRDELTGQKRKSLQRFLTPGRSTGADCPALKAVAREHADSSRHPLEKARTYFDLVVDRMSYERRDSIKGAKQAWNDAVGECCDYAAVFVSLCRYAGVPARPVCGYVLDENDRWDRHVWAEFYINGPGWIPCDPSFADTTVLSRGAFFAQLDSNRIAVTVGFDLDFSPPRYFKAPLFQEFLYAFSGTSKPSVQWQLGGGRGRQESTPSGGRPRPFDPVRP